MKSIDFKTKILLFTYLLCCFTGCTLSVTMVHTEGVAEDVVDETQTTSPNIEPEISIPLAPAIF